MRSSPATDSECPDMDWLAFQVSLQLAAATTVILLLFAV